MRYREERSERLSFSLNSQCRNGLVKRHKEQEAVEQDKEKKLIGLQAVAKDTRTTIARMEGFAPHKKEALDQSKIWSLGKR